MPELEHFDALVADVRATAPEPREQFVARLDRRVEAGFPRQRRARDKGWLWRPTLAVTLCTIVALVVAVTVLSGDERVENPAIGGSAAVAPEDGGGQDALPAPQTKSTPQLRDGSRLPAGQSAQGTENYLRTDPSAEAHPFTREGNRRADPLSAAIAPNADQTAPGNRRVVERRTSLSLEAGRDEFADVTDGVLRVADDTGTVVQRSRVTEQDGRGRATFDLRVPSSRLDEALADLSRLAHVTSRTASSTDITLPFVSAQNRLEDARDERAALLRALGRAETEQQADALRARIRDARRRIAFAERGLRRVRARADRARVVVTVESTGRITDEGTWTPGDALDDAGRVLEVAAGVAVVTGAVLIPLALVAILAALAARVVRRRRREAALG